MKTLITLLAHHASQWLLHLQADASQQQDELMQRDAYFEAHRVTPDPKLPAWSNAPDNPGVKRPVFRHVYDVAAPKTA